MKTSNHTVSLLRASRHCLPPGTKNWTRSAVRPLHGPHGKLRLPLLWMHVYRFVAWQQTFYIYVLLLGADRIENTVSLLLLPLIVFTELLPGSVLIKSVTYIFVYIYIHAYTDTYICTFIHSYVRACAHACMHTYIHMYVSTHARTHALTYFYIIIEVR
jgi:hypothetical protein